jgi:hypothetical protein
VRQESERSTQVDGLGDPSWMSSPHLCFSNCHCPPTWARQTRPRTSDLPHCSWSGGGRPAGGGSCWQCWVGGYLLWWGNSQNCRRLLVSTVLSTCSLVVPPWYLGAVCILRLPQSHTRT